MVCTADWPTELMQAHPRLFDLMPDKLERSRGYPLCEAGWRDILEQLCIRAEPALQENETFKFVRIKQKCGLLWVDWDAEISNETRANILNAVNLAVARSACTCEVCGTAARLYSNRSWLATRCAEHALGDAKAIEPGFENIHILRRVFGEPGTFYARYDRESDTLTEVSANSLGLEK